MVVTPGLLKHACAATGRQVNGNGPSQNYAADCGARGTWRQIAREPLQCLNELAPVR